MKRFALVLASAAFVLPFAASAQVNINVQLPGLVSIAPPPPRFEAAPGPRPGQIWIPGHWQWNERAYAWRPGYWQAARPDYAYAPGRWVQVDGGWRWMEGGWQPHRREERRERRRDDDRYERDDRDEHHGGGFCPPGQAKKGRC